MTAEHTIRGDVTSLDQLRDGDGRFLAGTVNVTGHVCLNGLELERLPVKFGTIGDYFNCNNNLLTSLEGAPSSVGGNLNCNVNRLTSLEGAPGTVGKDFWCGSNRLTSLVGVHRHLRRIDVMLHIWGNGIVTGGIGLLLVEGLTEIVANHPAFEIIGRHLGQGKKGLLRCQEELHEAGFKELAKL